MAKKQEERKYSIEEAASVLDMNPAVLRRHVKSQQIAAEDTGRGNGKGYRIAHAEVVRYAASRVASALGQTDPSVAKAAVKQYQASI